MATIKFVQSQKFSLAGAGTSIGDTTILLQSMLGIDGVAITTTDIGIAGFGTIEPGNGSQEEAIKFTGITQNANGTALLTGVSTVLFKSPYTATSGLAKTHAGASTFILSNDAAFYGAILDYVDQAVSSSGIPATNLVAGISKLSVAAASAANPIAVGDNDPRIPTPTGSALLNIMATSVGLPLYAAATGSANVYTATLNPIPASYTSGMIINVKIPSTNSSAATINVNSLGAKSITKNFNVPLGSGDVLTNEIVSLIYDGTQFQLMTPPAGTITQLKAGSTTHDVSTTGTQNIAHGLGVIPKMIRATGFYSSSNIFSSVCVGTYDGTNTNSVETVIDTTSTLNGTNLSTTNIIQGDSSAGGGARALASVTFDATNIILTWSKSGSPTGTMNILWEAQS